MTNSKDLLRLTLQRKEVERLIEVVDDIIDLNNNALKNLEPEDIKGTEQDTKFLEGLRAALYSNL